MSKTYNFGLLSVLEQKLLYNALVNIEKAFERLDDVVNESFSTFDSVSYDLDMRGEAESPLSDLLGSLRGHIEGLKTSLDAEDALDRAEYTAFKAWYDSMTLGD